MTRRGILIRSEAPSNGADGLSGYFDEAIQDELFAQLQQSDPLFVPYATAAFVLGEVSQLPPQSRAQFYRRVASQPRAQLLTELSRIVVRDGTVRLLAKTDYASFTKDDWRALLIACVDPALRKRLHNLKQISPVLAGQLALIPEAVRGVAMMEVLNTLAVSQAHWQQLAQSLTEAPENIRRSLIARANKVHSIGSFWDYLFRCTQGAWRSFTFPASFFASRLLKPLATAKAMKRESLRMKNCVGDKIRSVLAGREAYFHWNGTRPASVRMDLSGDGWRIGQIRAAHNRSVNRSETARIIEEAQQIIDQAPRNGFAVRDQFELAIDSVCEHAQRRFPARAIQRISRELRSIRGGSLVDSGSFCVIESKNGYIQFMADMTGEEFLCEIQSHHYVPEMEPRLTDPIVTLISECGFQWPEDGREQNFVSWLPVASDDDITKLGEFALGILSQVFDHIPDMRLKVVTKHAE